MSVQRNTTPATWAILNFRAGRCGKQEATGGISFRNSLYLPNVSQVLPVTKYLRICAALVLKCKLTLNETKNCFQVTGVTFQVLIRARVWGQGPTQGPGRRVLPPQHPHPPLGAVRRDRQPPPTGARAGRDHGDSPAARSSPQN